jgi:hypothetical protein
MLDLTMSAEEVARVHRDPEVAVCVDVGNVEFGRVLPARNCDALYGSSVPQSRRLIERCREHRTSRSG